MERKDEEDSQEEVQLTLMDFPEEGETEEAQQGVSQSELESDEQAHAKSKLAISREEFDEKYKRVDGKQKALYGLSALPIRPRVFKKRGWKQTIEEAMESIGQIADELDVPQETRELAFQLFSIVKRKGLFKGKGVTPITGAVVYVACRMTRVPRQLSRLAVYAGISWQMLAKYTRRLISVSKEDIRPFDAIEVLPRLCELIGASIEDRSKAEELLKEAMERNYGTSTSPWAIAGAALYIASVELDAGMTQRRIFRMCWRNRSDN